MTPEEYKTSLAKRLFDSSATLENSDSELYDELQAMPSVKDKYHSWSFDEYDTSLELYGIDPDIRLTDSEVKKFEALGFSIVWLNHTDGWETQYSLHRGCEYRTNRNGNHPRISTEDSELLVALRKIKKLEAEIATLQAKIHNLTSSDLPHTV